MRMPPLRTAWSLPLAVLTLAAPLAAQDHGPHGPAGARHGNPADLDQYIERLRDPARDAWQQPERVVAALGLSAGQTACDIGAGPGYFALRLARVVGSGGHVFAVDVEPVILDALRSALGEAGVENVSPVLALPERSLLPAGACDVVLIVNTYHHFPDGPAYLAALATALAPGGRVVNIDFRIDSPRGPRHKIAREEFLEQAQRAGYRLASEETFLEQQYFLTLRPAG